MAFPSLRNKRIQASLIAVAAAGALSLAACSTAAPETETEAAPEGAATVSTPVILKDGTLTVCTGDSPPNIFYDENNELQGVEIDIAKALAADLGLTTKFEEYAFSGLIPALQAKQCDVIMGSLYIKPEREEIANFVAYLYSGTGVGVSKDNPEKVTGFDDSLRGLNIVAITGATGGNGAEELSGKCEADGKKAIDITLVDEGTAAVQQVIAGQVDAFVDTSEIMSFYEKESDGAMKTVGEPTGKIKIGAATLKSNTELNEALDESFQAVIDSGDYQAILEEWGVEGNDITQPE